MYNYTVVFGSQWHFTLGSEYYLDYALWLTFYNNLLFLCIINEPLTQELGAPLFYNKTPLNISLTSINWWQFLQYSLYIDLKSIHSNREDDKYFLNLDTLSFLAMFSGWGVLIFLSRTDCKILGKNFNIVLQEKIVNFWFRLNWACVWAESLQDSIIHRLKNHFFISFVRSLHS